MSTAQRVLDKLIRRLKAVEFQEKQREVYRARPRTMRKGLPYARPRYRCPPIEVYWRNGFVRIRQLSPTKGWKEYRHEEYPVIVHGETFMGVIKPL